MHTHHISLTREHVLFYWMILITLPGCPCLWWPGEQVCGRPSCFCIVFLNWCRARSCCTAVSSDILESALACDRPAVRMKMKWNLQHFTLSEHDKWHHLLCPGDFLLKCDCDLIKPAADLQIPESPETCRRSHDSSAAVLQSQSKDEHTSCEVHYIHTHTHAHIYWYFFLNMWMLLYSSQWEEWRRSSLTSTYGSSDGLA